MMAEAVASHTAAKTPDHFFTGFPSYWNVVVLYLYVLGFSVWTNAAILIIFSVAVFVPIRYLYPSRNPIAQRPTYVFGGIWATAVLVLIWQLPQPCGRWSWPRCSFRRTDWR